MINNEHSWISIDRNNIFSRSWLPDMAPKAVICLIHGLGEHSGRYDIWANRFVADGFAIYACDLTGHGRSEGRRGGVKNHKTLISDVDHLIKYTARKHPDIPLVVYGHSMGGALALSHFIRKHPSIDGLIVTSPWLELALTLPPIKKLMCSVMSFLFPSLQLHNGLITDYLSHDPQVAVNYEKDPLVHNRISVKLFIESQASGNFVLRNKHKVNVNLLLMHGTSDKITSCHATKKFARNTASLTHLKLWEGMYHELHNETQKDQIYTYINEWLLNTVIKQKN